MKYIFMVAGKGSRLQPLTLKHPKSMYKLDENTTLLQRMVKLIKKHDAQADIVIVTGHMHRAIEEQVEGVRFVYNPFYEVTNSIASLWFAQKELDTDNVVLIDGDIVMSDEEFLDDMEDLTDEEPEEEETESFADFNDDDYDFSLPDGEEEDEEEEEDFEDEDEDEEDPFSEDEDEEDEKPSKKKKGKK